MLETIKDDQDKIVAYIEWNLVNNKGKTDDQGTYVFVRDLWCWKPLRGKLKFIRHFISEISRKVPTVRYAYWEREKYSGRMRIFNKERLVKDHEIVRENMLILQ